MGLFKWGKERGARSFFDGLDMGANTFFEVSNMGARTSFEVKKVRARTFVGLVLTNLKAGNKNSLGQFSYL